MVPNGKRVVTDAVPSLGPVCNDAKKGRGRLYRRVPLRNLVEGTVNALEVLPSTRSVVINFMMLPACNKFSLIEAIPLLIISKNDFDGVRKKDFEVLEVLEAKRLSMFGFGSIDSKHPSHVIFLYGQLIFSGNIYIKSELFFLQPPCICM